MDTPDIFEIGCFEMLETYRQMREKGSFNWGIISQALDNISIATELLKTAVPDSQIKKPKEIPKMSFDVGNGVITEGDSVVVHSRAHLGIGRVLTVYQDGDVEIEFRSIETVKWRYVLPVDGSSSGDASC